MLKIEEGIEMQKKERNAAAKAEIRETLKKMIAGQSFLIEGKIKKGTVKAVAKAENIGIMIGKDAAGLLRCIRK